MTLRIVAFSNRINIDSGHAGSKEMDEGSCRKMRIYQFVELQKRDVPFED